jgi:hypothetical protein
MTDARLPLRLWPLLALIPALAACGGVDGQGTYDAWARSVCRADGAVWCEDPGPVRRRRGAEDPL